MSLSGKKQQNSLENGMRNLLKIATSTASLASLALLCLTVLTSVAGSAYASELAGTITELSGGLMVKKSNGIAKIQGISSSIEVGDTVITPKNTFVRIKFLDDTEMILKPGTRLVIESWVSKPDASAYHTAIVNLERGGINLLAAPDRGQEKMAILLKTRLAELNITGASAFIALTEASEAKLASLQTYLRASTASFDAAPIYSDIPRGTVGIIPLPMLAQSTPGSGGGLAPGLYVHVIDGLIQLSNRGGVQQFSAGQFGFTGSVVQPPVIVPNNPGIQFNPPPAFQSGSGPQSNAGTGSKPKTVDCEVR
jgi:hypothetical protein